MKSYRNLYLTLCSYENLCLAFRKARKGKTRKDYVIRFEERLEDNLNQLKHELETFTYSPAPLATFIIRDPKTRRISASHFRDRVVHHALCNIISPILEKDFIYDSFANQRGKGTHKAIKRFETFMRKIRLKRRETMRRQTKLFDRAETFSYALKADIRHYFDTADHEILLRIIERKIRDPGVIWLIKTILENHKSEIAGKGMPIGNLTSQFFANVYLGELDLFVKHKLKAKYYIRYVDDFVILHRDKKVLEKWKRTIDDFLKTNLRIESHSEKTRVIQLEKGITLLGFRVFPKYKLLKRSNARRIWKRLGAFERDYSNGNMTEPEIIDSINGWLAYAKFANTYKLRKRVTGSVDHIFANTPALVGAVAYDKTTAQNAEDETSVAGHAKL